MNNTYCGMRECKITDGVFFKAEIRITYQEINNIIINFKFVSCTIYSFFEDHIIHQIKTIIGGLENKVEEHIG